MYNSCRVLHLLIYLRKSQIYYDMYHYKPTTYEKMEKQPKEKKFKQNSYEEIRKIVEDGEDTNKVKEIKNKKKNNNEKSYNFKLFD